MVDKVCTNRSFGEFRDGLPAKKHVFWASGRQGPGLQFRSLLARCIPFNLHWSRIPYPIKSHLEIPLIYAHIPSVQYKTSEIDYKISLISHQIYKSYASLELLSFTTVAMTGCSPPEACESVASSSALEASLVPGLGHWLLVVGW